MAGGTTDRPCEADCCHRTLFRVIGSRVHHLIQDPKQISSWCRIYSLLRYARWKDLDRKTCACR
ncbi:hypothetical protein IG631_12367 [Alternaria alternata]|nr:hypothetical protein IG631_12367 [Alternaria alternata]